MIGDCLHRHQLATFRQNATVVAQWLEAEEWLNLLPVPMIVMWQGSFPQNIWHLFPLCLEPHFCGVSKLECQRWQLMQSEVKYALFKLLAVWSVKILLLTKQMRNEWGFQWKYWRRWFARPVCFARSCSVRFCFDSSRTDNTATSSNAKCYLKSL